jgi:hypothetical protein
MKVRSTLLKQVAKVATSAKNYKTSLLSSSLAFLTLFLSSSLTDLARGLNPLSNSTMWVSLVLLLCGSFLWLLSTERGGRWTQYGYVRERFRKPRICVLGSRTVSDDSFTKVARCCEFAPSIWANELQALKLEASAVEFSESTRDCDVLINPFGERYLESDVANMRTLKQLKQFVRDGGVFVNVGGLAFFYAYDPRSEVEGLTGATFEYYIGGVSNQLEYRGITGNYKPATILEREVYVDASSTRDTCLYANLGCRTTLSHETTRQLRPANDDFADLVNSDSRVQEYRAIERCESSDAFLLPIFKSDYQPNYAERKHECYPIAAISLGLGCFIICGIVAEEEYHRSLVEQTIVRLCDVLSKNGHLKTS